MSWSDWEFVWRRQPLPADPEVDLERLRRTFEERHRRLARALMVRDWTEAAAGLFAAIVFGLFGLTRRGPDWPIWVAVALVMGVTLFFVRERMRTRRDRLGPDAPVLRKVEADLAELRRQRWLLKNMAAWYLAPIFLSTCFIGLAVWLRVSARGSQHGLVNPVILTVLIAFAGWGAWALNQRAVRKQIDPRLAELEELRRAMRGGS